MSRRTPVLLLIAAVAILTAVPMLTPLSAAAVGTADLSVSMTGDAKSLKFGKTMTLTVTVTNAGPDLATGVAVSIGVSDSLADFGGTCPDGSVSDFCTIGELAPGASVTVEFQVMARNQCCPEFVGIAVASVRHDADTVDPIATNDSSRLEIRLKGKPLF